MDTKNYATLLKEMKESAIANGSGLTDFNDGSNVMTVFESVARPMEQLYIDTRNGYTNNLRAIPYSVFDFKQKDGQKATVLIQFTRNAPLASVSTIPSGTRVSNGSLFFVTTETATIPATTKATVKLKFSRASAIDSDSIIPVGTKVSNGNLVFITTQVGVIESGEVESGEIEAQAENVGVVYNVAADTITTIVSTTLPSDVVQVNNPDAASGGTNETTISNTVNATAENVGLEYNVAENTITTIESNLTAEIIGCNNPQKAVGGSDAETPTQMLRRFKYMINGLQGSNKYGIMAGVLALSGVRSVGIDEHFPPKSNIYNFTLYVDDGTGSLTEDLKNEVIDVVNGDETEEKPGLKAAGINVEISAAQIVSINVVVTATIYRVEQARVENDIYTKLSEYINGLGIHENVILSSIIVLLKQISGITDISGLTLNGQADNVIISKSQIARFNSVNATIINP